MASKAQNSPAHAANNTANNAGHAQNNAVNAAINAITKNGGAIKIVMPDQNGDFTTAVSHSAVDKVQVVDVDMVLQLKDGTSVVLAGGAISAMDASHTTIKFNDGPQDTLSHLLDQVGMIAVPQLDQVLSSLQAPPGSSGEGAGSYSPSAAADTGMSASVTSQIVNQLTQIVETNAQSATIQTVDPTAQVAVLSQNLNTGKIDSQPLQQIQPPILPERPGVIPQEHTVGPDAPNMTLSLVNLATITQIGNVLYGSGGTVASATDASNTAQFASQVINAPADATEIHAVGNIPPNDFIKVVNIAVTGDGIVQSVIVKGVPAGMSIANGTDLGGGNWSIAVDPGQKNFDIQLEYTTTPADPTDPIHSQFSMEFDVNLTTSDGVVSMSQVKQFAVKDVSSANDLTYIDSTTGESVYVLPAQGNSHVVHGGDGGVTIFGGNAADFLFGGAGADTINGGSGNSYFEGGAGADHMIGGIGINTVGYTLSAQGVAVNLLAGTGSAGDAAGDVFVHMTNVIGSAHDDTFVSGVDANNIDGGSGGSDTVSYQGSTAVVVDLGTGTGTGGNATGDKLTHIQNVTGSTHNDTFIASTAANAFDGGGHDVNGADTVSYASDTSGQGVVVDLFNGSQTAGAATGDTYTAIQNIIGTSSNDKFIDGAGTDGNRYDGGLGGQDTVSYEHSTSGVFVNFVQGRGSSGSAAGDTYTNIQNVIGSAYDDVFTAARDSKSFNGGAGGIDEVDYSAADASVTIDTINNVGMGSYAGGQTYTNIEKFVGSGSSDTFIASNAANQFDGGAAGSDTVDYSHSVDAGGAAAGVTVDLFFTNGDGTSGGYAQGDVLTNIANVIGGGGDDVFFANATQNTFDGRGGNNTVSYFHSTSQSGTGVTVDLSNSDGTGTGGNFALGDKYIDIQNVIGSAFDDTFVASAEANRFDGGSVGPGVRHNRVSYANDTSGLGVTVDLATGADTAGGAAGDTYVDIQDVTGTGLSDTFIASIEANAFDGGAGIDTVSYKGSATGVTVDLVAGTGSGGNADGDTYTRIENVTGGDADDTFIASSIANSFDGGLGSLNNTVSYAKASDGVGVIVDLFAGTGTAGFADGDHYVRIQDVIGSTNNDTFVANDAHNKFDGGGGTHDRVSYADSTDAVTVDLIANTGTGGLADGDTYAGIQDVTGGTGDDMIIASSAANNFDGGKGGLAPDGNDTVSYHGTAGDNSIDLHTAGAAATGTGFAAGDTYVGIENIIGGAGNDTFYASAAANKFDGDGGNNTVNYSKSGDAFGVIVDLSTATGTGKGNGVGNALLGDAAGDTYVNIQNVVGTLNDDLFIASDAANKFDGGKGGLAQDGNDTVSYAGTAGDNTIDLKTAGAAATGTGFAAGDTYVGIENITGGTGNDRFYAGAAANKFDGDGGINTVDYSKSGDAFGVIVDLSTTIGTGSGNGAGHAAQGDAAGDTYVHIQNVVGTVNDDLFIASNVANKFDGGKNGLAPDGIDTVSYAGTAGDNTIDLKTAGAAATGTGFAAGDTYVGIENITGGLGNDRFYASAAANKFDGDGGVNTVDYSKSGDTHGVIVDLSTEVGAGVGTGSTMGGGAGDAAGDTYTHIQNAVGTNQDDTFIANGVANFFDGGTGTTHNRVSYQASTVADGSITVDLIAQTGSGGLAEGDTYANIQDATGGAADDLFIASNAANNFDGRTGVDTVSYHNTNGDNSINLKTAAAQATGTGFAAGDTYTGIENVIGGNGNDTFFASGVANKFDGDGGTDNRVDYSLSGDGFGVIVDLVGNTGASNGAGAGDATGDTYLAIQDATGTNWDDKFIANNVANQFDGKGGSHNRVSYEDSNTAVTVDLNAGTGANGDAAGDKYTNIQDATGGSGDDIFIASNVANNFDGGKGGLAPDGNDTVSYHNTNGDNSINLKTAGAQATGAGFANGDTYTGIENVIGGNGNDTFFASAAANKFDGDGGADNRVNYSLSTDGFGVIVDLFHNTGASNGAGVGDATGDTYVAIQDATGTNNFDDKFIANNVANKFDGGNSTAASHNVVSYEFSTTSVTVDLRQGTGANNDAAGDKYTNIQDAIGGSGDDTFVGSTAANNFDGGVGSDTVDYSHATTSVVVDLSSSGLPIASTGDALAAGDTYTHMENIIGGSGNDTLTGATGGNSTLVGGAGADALTGQGSNNTASYVGSGAVIIDLTQHGAGSGGDAAGDTFVDIQNVIGSSNDDKFYASSDANKFDGGAAGSDTVSYERQNTDGSVTTGVNVDLSNGAAAATGGYAEGDTYVRIHNLIGTDLVDTLKGATGGGSTLTGGKGGDTLIGQGFVVGNAATANTANYATSVNGVTVDLVHGLGTGGDAQDDHLSGIQNVIGTGQNDTFIIAASSNSGGTSDPNTVDGGSGGSDTVSYANETNAVTVDLSPITGSGHGFSTGSTVQDTLTHIQNAIGGAGNDLFIAGNSANSFDGGSTGAGTDSDTVSYASSSTGAVNDPAHLTVTTTGVIVDLFGHTGSGNWAAGDTYTSIENVIGSNGSDLFISDDSSITANKYDGGADGSDTVSYEHATTSFMASLAAPGSNTGEAHGDTYSHISNLMGSAVDGVTSTLTGDGSANTLTALGNDTINILNGGGASSGSDILDGRLGGQNTLNAGDVGNTIFEVTADGSGNLAHNIIVGGVHGSSAVDTTATMKVDGIDPGVSLNMSSFTGHADHLTVVDLKDGVDTDITISYADVLALGKASGGVNGTELTLNLDDHDSVKITEVTGEHWKFFGNGDYVFYADSDTANAHALATLHTRPVTG
jgi:hypothetical protein